MGKFSPNSIRGQILAEIIQICKSYGGSTTKVTAVKELSSKGYNPYTINASIYAIQKAIKKKEISELSYDFDNKRFFLKQIVKEYEPKNESSQNIQPKEESFYQPFANFLVNTLKECSRAIALGGAQFKDKWGTPDVLGIFKFPELAPIKPFPEIVTAEIKLDETQIITAFGQACAYKLFSHKVYLVIPSSTPPEDIARTESLCMKFGIGLITFDKDNPENPRFTIRTRAIKHEPDYSFVNNYLQKLTNEQQNKLFG